MHLCRRGLLKAGAASIALGTVAAPFVTRAQSAEFTYKYANNLPITHPMNVRAQEMAAAIKQDLAGKGMVFNKPDPASFRDKLRSANFYTDWKAKYGEEAWALLEKSVGKLS